MHAKQTYMHMTLTGLYTREFGEVLFGWQIQVAPPSREPPAIWVFVER